MAAATVASQSRQHEFGDLSGYFVSLTSLADTNTLAGRPGLNVLGFILLTSTTSASVTASVASNTLTFNVSAGTPDVTGFVVTGTK